MIKKSAILFLAMIFLFSMFSFPAFSEDENKLVLSGTVTGTTKLHMRSSPSTEGSVITDLKSGAKVTVLENDGNWCYVEKNGRSGYVMSKYLKITPDYTHNSWAETKKEDILLTLYSRPDPSSAVLCRFWSGARFEVIENNGTWKKVRVGSLIGYLDAPVSVIPEGDFALAVYPDSISRFSVHYSTYDFHSRAFGEELTVSGSKNALTYRFTYPVCGIESADTLISGWMKKQRDALSDSMNGTLEINYESWLTSSVAGIVLYSRYQDASSSCENVYAFNIDTETGKVFYADSIFSDSTRPLLILDSKIASFLLEDADGYDVTPDLSCYAGSVITPDGLSVFLRSGHFLPICLGTQKIDIAWNELTGCIDPAYGFAPSSRIDPSRPMLCLTFDDGPHEQTERILDTLLKNGAHASFCVQGRRISDYESTVRRTVAEGNELVCHTYSHKKLTELSAANVKSQITRVQDEIGKVIPGYRVKWLRCPYGSTNRTVRNVCKDLDMCIAFWQIDTEDWSTRSADSTYRAIMKQAKNGAIILCHDIYSTTADAIERAVPELIEQGYQLVTLSEMFSYMKDGPVPGTVYTCLSEEDR